MIDNRTLQSTVAHYLKGFLLASLWFYWQLRGLYWQLSDFYWQLWGLYWQLQAPGSTENPSPSLEKGFE
jgi:hypothetical protein